MRKIPMYIFQGETIPAEKLIGHWKKFGTALTQEEHEALDRLLAGNREVYPKDEIRRALEAAMD